MDLYYGPNLRACIGNDYHDSITDLLSPLVYYGERTQRRIETLKIGNYLEFDGQYLSFLPTGKSEETNPYKSRFRVKGRVGRILHRLFPYAALTDSQIECFGNHLRAQWTYFTLPVTVVRGEDIRYHYLSYNTHPESRIRSCMSGTYAQDFLDIYCVNKNIRLAVILKDGMAVARALLWSATDGKTYIDGVYGSQVAELAMEKHAENVGWLQADKYSFDVALERWRFDHYPYVDRVYYLTPNKLSTTYQGRGCWQLTSTEGEGGPVSCRSCGDEDIYEDTLCRDCWLERNGTQCNHCGEMVEDDDVSCEHGMCYCESCWESMTCSECNEETGVEYLTDGLCEECRSAECERCGERCQKEQLDNGYCYECVEQLTKRCDICDEPDNVLYPITYLPQPRPSRVYMPYNQRVGTDIMEMIGVHYACAQCVNDEHEQWLRGLEGPSHPANLLLSPQPS